MVSLKPDELKNKILLLEHYIGAARHCIQNANSFAMLYGKVVPNISVLPALK